MDSVKAVEQIWWAGVEAVKGRASVATVLTEYPVSKPHAIIAVGKAAEDMAVGAWDILGDDVPTLIVTKYDHLTDASATNANCTAIEAAHPVPDDQSLKAGKTLIKWMKGLGPNAHVLCLISGGASALAEHLVDGVDKADLIALNSAALSGGLPIGQINARRKQISAIKAGKLFDFFGGKMISVIGLSDVEGDDFATIGSGLMDARADARATCRLAASNAVARNAAAAKASALGFDVTTNEETLYMDVKIAAARVAEHLLSAQSGVHIWGGEPTVMLPENPGRGGRNQALATAIAMQLRGANGITCLVAGTDGTDGPTTAAGGLVTGQTVTDHDAATKAMETAACYDFLLEQGALFETGPTGTNVMDVIVAIKD